MELCKTLNVTIFTSELKFCPRSYSSSCVYLMTRFKSSNGKVCKMMTSHFRTLLLEWWRHTLELCYWNRQQLSDLKNTNGGLAIYYRKAPRLSLRKGVEVSLFLKRYIHSILSIAVCHLRFGGGLHGLYLRWAAKTTWGSWKTSSTSQHFEHGETHGLWRRLSHLTK